MSINIPNVQNLYEANRGKVITTLLTVAVIWLAGCNATKPQKPSDICDILEQKTVPMLDSSISRVKCKQYGNEIRQEYEEINKKIFDLDNINILEDGLVIYHGKDLKSYQKMEFVLKFFKKSFPTEYNEFRKQIDAIMLEKSKPIGTLIHPGIVAVQYTTGICPDYYQGLSKINQTKPNLLHLN